MPTTCKTLAFFFFFFFSILCWSFSSVHMQPGTIITSVAFPQISHVFVWCGAPGRNSWACTSSSSAPSTDHTTTETSPPRWALFSEVHPCPPQYRPGRCLWRSGQLDQAWKRGRDLAFFFLVEACQVLLCSMPEPLQLIKSCTFNCHQLITDHTDSSSESWFHTASRVLSLAILPQLKGGFLCLVFLLEEAKWGQQCLQRCFRLCPNGGEEKQTNQPNKKTPTQKSSEPWRLTWDWAH